ncbi:MAG: MFS transporter [Chloroflexi bacterium]|nr:MFS transporter [Chloroflexota bacterium]MCI0647590.1 MFS transporter [Chloroflexota bacterium]
MRSLSSLTRRRAGQTAWYYIAFVTLGLAGASLGPTLPGLAEQTDARLGEASFLFAGRALGYLAGSWLAGRLYDRRPGHPVMAGMLLAMAVMMALVPLVPWLWLLAAVLLLLGVAEAGLDVGGNTLLVWLYRDKVGPFMNGLHFFFGLGAFLAPVIVAQALSYSGGIAWAYWTLALVMALASAGLFRQPSPAIVKSDPATGSAPVNYRVVALIVVFFFLYAGAEISFGGWIFTYATAQGMGETPAAYLNSAFWGSFTLARLLSIPLATRVRPSVVVRAGLVGCLAGVAVLVFWPGSETVLWAGTVVTGMAMAAIFPTMLAVAERRIPITGRVTSWFFMAVSVGAMIVPWIIGQLFDRIGPQAAPLTLLADLTLAAIVFATLIVYAKRRPVLTASTHT